MLRRLLPRICLLPCLLVSLPAAAAVVSVLDFEYSGISEHEMVVFVDHLGTAVAKLGTYDVVDRAQRERILEEIEFSIGDCTDQACQLQMGRLLSANLVVAGSIGPFGRQYVLNLKLLDVETGRVVSSESKSYRSVDRILSDSARIVGNLFKDTANRPVRPEAQPQSGSPTKRPLRHGGAIELSAGFGYGWGVTDNWYRSPEGVYSHVTWDSTAPPDGTLVDFRLGMPGAVATLGGVYQFLGFFSVGVFGGVDATRIDYSPDQSSGAFVDRWVWSPVGGAKIVFGNKVDGVGIAVLGGWDNGFYGGIGTYYRGFFVNLRSFAVAVDSSRDYASGGASVEAGYSLFLGQEGS